MRNGRRRGMSLWLMVSSLIISALNWLNLFEVLVEKKERERQRSLGDIVRERKRQTEGHRHRQLHSKTQENQGNYIDSLS